MQIKIGIQIGAVIHHQLIQFKGDEGNLKIIKQSVNNSAFVDKLMKMERCFRV